MPKNLTVTSSLPPKIVKTWPGFFHGGGGEPLGWPSFELVVQNRKMGGRSKDLFVQDYMSSLCEIKSNHAFLDC